MAKYRDLFLISFNTFPVTGLFLYDLKTENFWFSDVFMAVEKAQWHEKD